MAIEFSTFKKEVEAAGFTAIDCGKYHWRIKGGLYEVNWYPRSKRKTIYINGLGANYRPTEGDLAAAVRAASEHPDVKPPERRTKRKGSYKSLKRRLFKKSGLCFWCSLALTAETATIDHKIPLARGGSNAQDNTVLACEPCNREKGHGIWEKKDGQTIKLKSE